MDLDFDYEIWRVANFIRSNNFTRVALQFPDELLKDSTVAVKALRQVLDSSVKLYVMAGTTYGSCCVDEVGAAHVNAECVIHFGHTCLSPYYLVEKAKDANMIGILVGTLGAVGYLHMIHHIQELITKDGKKPYTFVMGKPNPSKLANFPECDVFVNVACAQTALLDSKEFFAPIITPFEAMLALDRGIQWTGGYVMEFQDLIGSTAVKAREQPEEARFSFLQGGYVEDLELKDIHEVEKDGVLALVNATEKALRICDDNSQSVTKGTARSGAEYFASRSYHGLDINVSSSLPENFLIGKSGKASGYKNENVDA